MDKVKMKVLIKFVSFWFGKTVGTVISATLTTYVGYTVLVWLGLL